MQNKMKMKKKRIKMRKSKNNRRPKSSPPFRFSKSRRKSEVGTKMLRKEATWKFSLLNFILLLKYVK